MNRTIIALALFTMIACGCAAMTRAQEAGIKGGAEVVGTGFGIPPLVTDTLVGLLLAASHYIAHRMGVSAGSADDATDPVTPPIKPVAP